MDPFADLAFDPRAPERRRPTERRRVTPRSLLHGVLFGNRRRGPRRAADHEGFYVDWYEPGLLYLTVAVLLMSCADAFLTLVLLDLGAVEVNLLMARLIETDIRLFTVVKTGLTGLGLIVIVVHFSFRLFGRLAVRRLLSLFFLGYLVLLTHELAMLSRLVPI